MIDKLISEFEDVKIDKVLFSDSEKEFLSALDRKYQAIDDDSRMILNKMPILEGVVSEERKMSNRGKEGFFDIDSFSKEVRDFRRINFNRYVGSLRNFFVESYGLSNAGVGDAFNDCDEVFDYRKFSEMIINHFKVRSFSEIGYKNAINDISVIFSKSHLKGSKLVFSYIPLSFSINGEVNRVGGYYNTRYDMLLKAISMFERGSNKHIFKQVDTNHLLFTKELLPYSNQRPSQSITKTFDVSGRSICIESIRFYMNDRIDVKFKDEEKAIEFFEMFNGTR